MDPLGTKYLVQPGREFVFIDPNVYFFGRHRRKGWDVGFLIFFFVSKKELLYFLF